MELEWAFESLRIHPAELVVEPETGRMGWQDLWDRPESFGRRRLMELKEVAVVVATR